MAFFTSDPEVAGYAKVCMLHTLLFNSVATVYEVAGAVLRGMGYFIVSTLITIFGTCAIRILWIYIIFAWFPAFETLINVYPVTWVITGTAVLAAYFIIRRKVFLEI